MIKSSLNIRYNYECKGVKKALVAIKMIVIKTTLVG